MLCLILASLLCIASAFRFPTSNFISRARYRSISSTASNLERISFLDSSFLLLENDPKYDSMKKYSMILANVTDHLEDPKEASQIVGAHLPWLLTQNIPQLTDLMLETIPALRKDKIMCLGYDFMRDCLTFAAQGARHLTTESEKLLNDVLKASSVSSQELDSVISERIDELSHEYFMGYLENQIEKCTSDSSRKHLLSLLKLRIVEEQGKKLGLEERAIAELCVLDNSDERRMLARQYLEGLSEVDQKRLYSRVVELLEEMDKGSAGNVSVYSNARDLEAILRSLIFE